MKVALQVVKSCDILLISGDEQHLEATLNSVYGNLRNKQIVVAMCKDAKLSRLQVCLFSRSRNSISSGHSARSLQACQLMLGTGRE